jgi:hypothetical protein
MELLTAFEGAVASTAEIVKSAPPGQLDGPTPCAEWDVRAAEPRDRHPVAGRGPVPRPVAPLPDGTGRPSAVSFKNVTGNKIMKPMLITAFGERRTKPRVIQARDRAEANSTTSAVAASTPAAPPARWLSACRQPWPPVTHRA